MKKQISYLAILATGLLLGWILFGDSSNNETTHNHTTVTATNQMWTCSMHPQIMQPESGDCPICGMDLIPAASTSVGLSVNQFKLTENAMALANIETSIVGINTMERKGIKLSGKITANEDKTATQPAHFNGRIEKLFVNSVGERVKIGQPIAQIYSPELVAAQQELITAYRIKESQPQLYKAVRNKFKYWKIHDSQLSEIETSGQVKTSFTINSHVSGIVSEIIVNQGAHIMDGHPIFKVVNLATVWALFDVYENQIDLFKIGQAISITTNAYPNKEFNAKVDFIDPVFDTKTRTVKLRAVLSNKDKVFKPGMFVEGVIENNTSNTEQVITIPASAILWTGKRSVVYIKTNKEQPIFEMREISLGNQMGNHYQITEGINIGDEIVTNGTFTVDAAAQLQGKKSMMNKEGGKVMTGHEGHVGMNETGTESNESYSNLNERITVAPNFQMQLKAVFNDYIKVKDALVKDKRKQVVTASKQLLNDLVKVDMKLLSDNTAHIQWMSIEKEIKAAATAISNTSKIKKQRNHFKQLSTHMASAVEIFGINEKVYHQFCPMANSNKGAYWLSKEEKVVNPYFGQAMLTCGEVKQIIE